MKNTIILAALLLALAGCQAGVSGNALIDYRMDSFSGVNHCTHTTQLRCR